MAADLSFVADTGEDLITKHAPTLAGMGAGAGIVTTVRSAISSNTSMEMNMLTTVGVDLGLFLGAGWASNEYSRGMAGKFTYGMLLAGSLALVNDVWTAVTDQGLMEYTESLFATTVPAGNGS